MSAFGDRVCAAGGFIRVAPPRRGRAWDYSVPFPADAQATLRWLAEAHGQLPSTLIRGFVLVQLGRGSWGSRS